MATNPTTLQILITLVREKTNMENDNYVTDTEITSYLNNGLSVMDAILVSKFDDYKIAPVLTNVINTNQLALPADFLKFRGLDIQYNANNPDGYLTVRPHAFQKRNEYNYPGTAVIPGPYGVTYRLQGQMVILLPAILASQFTYRLWYTPDYIPLANPTDTLQSYMDSQEWYQYAVACACIDVFAKQFLDTSVFERKAAELKDHLIRMATPNRDAGAPKAVVDTRDSVGSTYANTGYGWFW